MSNTLDQLRNMSQSDLTHSTPEFLRAARAELKQSRDESFATVQRLSKLAGNGLTRKQRADFDAAEQRVDESARLLEAVEGELSRKEAPAHPGIGGWSVTRNESTYRQDGSNGASWVRDMMNAGLHGSADARERLSRNSQEVAAESRALTTAQGSAGEFVPPAWLVAQAVELARAGRVTADVVSKLALPPGTDSISLPVVASGTSTAEQTTQNTDLDETDMTASSVSAAVATHGGVQVLPVQLIEQSPASMDQVVLRDLVADLANTVNTFVLSNNATNKVGLLNVTGTNAVTYTSDSPTAAELYPKVADAIQQVHTSRFAPPSVIVMHPRRWAWLTAESDTSGRPLVVPATQMPQNSAAAMGAVASQGLVGSMQGVAVYTDPLIPTGAGTGENEDKIIVMKADEVFLYESALKGEAFREPLAQQLSVLIRVYQYTGLIANRRPSSISVIGGTGLAAPTF